METNTAKPLQFKHQRVEAELRRLVGRMSKGNRLPSERQLADQFECNFLTVRRALKAMVDDGTVIRRIGSGTFVAKEIPRPAPAASADRLGVLVWSQGDAYSNRVLQGVADASLGEGVELRSCWVRDLAAEGLIRAKQLREEGCLALTLPWFPHDRQEEVRAFVRACPLPVSLPMVVPGLEANCFESQEVFGANLPALSERLCEYFQALGHKRIALLGPDAPGDPVLQRYLGAYACHVSRAGLPTMCGLVGNGAAAMNRLAERWQDYRGELAIISYDDAHALRFMTAMHRLGLGAPTDFAIVGHNDTEACAFSDPPLSTVRQNFDYVGRWLIRSALGLAKGAPNPSREIPSLQLCVRMSCGGHGRITDSLRAALPGLELQED